MTSPDALLHAAFEWAVSHPRTTIALMAGWIAGARIILGAPL